jgi:hypothetical protein
MTDSTVVLVVDDRENVVQLHRGDGLKARYDYLADGRMIRREVGGHVFQYDWDGPRLRAIYDGTGRMLAAIHYDPAFGIPLAVVMGRQVYFCHPNAFGQVAWLTDEKGKPSGPPDGFPFQMRRRDEPPLSASWTGTAPAVWLPEEGLLLARGRLCESRSGDFLSPDSARFLLCENPYRARVVARPLDPTPTWDEIAQTLAWVEDLDRPRFARRWPDQPDERLSLADLARLVRHPERFDRWLFRRALTHDFNPDRYFALVSGCEAAGALHVLPRPSPSPPASSAEAFFDFSPFGPIPFDWSPMRNPVVDRVKRF